MRQEPEKRHCLKVLCDQPDIKRGGILLLAPTGKARVRMETQIGISGAMTIAQFLVRRKRYDPKTGRYCLSNVEKMDAGQTVIIDESSMLTEEQLGAVLDALRAAEPADSRRRSRASSRRSAPVARSSTSFDDSRRMNPHEAFPWWRRAMPN